MKPQGPGEKITFGSEMHIYWNRPVVFKADSVLARSLDRKKWNFKSGNTKFYTSAVVDRKKVESSHLSFLEEEKLTYKCFFIKDHI